MKSSDIAIIAGVVIAAVVLYAVLIRPGGKPTRREPSVEAPKQADRTEPSSPAPAPKALPAAPETKPSPAPVPAPAPAPVHGLAALLPHPPIKWQPLGLGGGGAMYCPASSPHNPDLMFVSCDMGGFYRSVDGGRTWRMIDFRQTRGSTVCKPAFHPKDPNVIYFKNLVSADQGITWKPIAENVPFGDVTEIALDHAAGNFIAIGSGDALHVSRDAGKTWEKCAGVSGRVIGLYVDPLSAEAGERLFIATETAILRSDDSGRSFSEKIAGLPWKEIRDLAGARSADRSKLVLYCTVSSKNIGGAYQGGVYRSADLAESWHPVEGGGLNKGLVKIDEYGDGDIAQYFLLGVAAGRPEIVYVSCRGTGYWPPNHSTVYRSDDGGKTWRFIYNRDFRFKELNVDNGWIPYALSWIWGGFHTGNGFGINPAHPDVALWTDSGCLDITLDGGKSWRGAYSKYAPGQDKPEPQPGRKPGFWQSVGLEVTSTWNYRIDPFNHDHHFICYTDVGIAYSFDRGKTWCNNSRSGGSPWTNTTYDLVFDPDKKDLLWAAMSNVHDIPHWTYTHDQAKGAGGVCISEDGGLTWKTSNQGLPSAPIPSIILDPKSPVGNRTLYVAAYDYGVFKSTDNGRSWTAVNNGIDLQKNSHTWLVKLHPDGTLFCGVTARRVGGRSSRNFPECGALYRSLDAGRNWEDITASCPLHWPNEFAVDPNDSNIIYLSAGTIPGGREGGIYKTADGGKSWVRLLRDEDFEGKGGPSYVHGMFVTMDPKDPNTVYLGTSSHGLWVTHDAGKSWQQVPELPFGSVHRLTFDPDNHNTVYVTTFGGGVWKGPRP